METPIRGVCPVCEQTHSSEPTSVFEETDSTGKKVKYHARPDVFCSCGQILRWTVPLFKSTENGHELRVKALKLRSRLSPNLKEAHWDDVKVGVMVIIDEVIYGRITSIDKVGHLWVDGVHFPFTIEHSFKITPVL